MKTYAGIGSRKTPADIQEKMTEIAKKLSRSNYLLRSGGAYGADSAFERGADSKEMYLPWDGFNDKRANDIDYIIPPVNNVFVARFHPHPNALGVAGRFLMSRNAYQVLGRDLNDPVDFVLCWTADGKASGGTGHAIRIANEYKIPVFNLKNGFEDFSSFMVMSKLLD